MLIPRYIYGYNHNYPIGIAYDEIKQYKTVSK